MPDLNSIFYIIVLLMSVVVHEVAHGYAALYFGDKTAEYAGRLTLNPLKHLDPFGSVILPLLLVISNAPFLIGWAKPVPYNPANLRDQKKGVLWVASAGILVNLAIAIFFGLVIRISVATGILGPSFVSLASVIVLLNIVLAIFNLIPIPPLDGSKILFTLLGNSGRKIEALSTKYSLFILLFFIFFLWKFISPVVYSLFALITGLSL
jgi:Zn-dependent protease